LCVSEIFKTPKCQTLNSNLNSPSTPFSKGDVIKRVPEKISRPSFEKSPFFGSPSLEKHALSAVEGRGQGRFVKLLDGLINFAQLPFFSKGGVFSVRF
jgi:hypothetical protein